MEEATVRFELVDINEILKTLPHRFPMLLVDRIEELEEDRVVGIKIVTANEPFFIRLGCVSDVVLQRYNNLLIDAWSRYVVGSGHPEQYQTLRYATTCVDEEYEQRWEFPPSRDEYYDR